MIIKFLNWDSEVFGYKVGKIILNSNENHQEVMSFLNQNKLFKLIYIISVEEIIGLNHLFHETKITY